MEADMVTVAEDQTTVDDRMPTDLAMVRELVLRAHPDVVPELVAGASVDELVASVEAARAAYRRVAEAVRTEPPRVPAGDTPRLAVDVELLPAAEKIRRGLATRS